MRHLSLADARLTVLGRQRLPASVRTPLEVVEGAGFVRTLGGVDAYLALRARARGLTRAAVDAAVASHALQVVPAVRGCIYLVPRRHVALCLRVAETLTADRTAREHAKVGVGPAELAEVGRAVVAALAAGPLTTDALRRALPPGAVRSFGEAGKKIGLSSTLPPALRVLESTGAIERTLEGGRLDTERYRWRLAARSVFDEVRIPDSHERRLAALAAIFFDAAGLSTVASFADWCGIAQRDARDAVARLGLELIAVDGRPGDWLLAPGAEPAPAARDAVALCAFEDNLTALPGGPGLLVDDADQDRMVPTWGGGDRPQRLGDARYLSMRPIVAEGRFAGFWEYDPDRRAIVTATFGALGAATARQLAAAAEETAAFIRDELGHARSFNLDTDDELRKRAAAVAKLAGGAKSAPAKSAPAKSAPAKSAPAKQPPAKSTPAKSTPAKSTPAKSAPAKSAPAKSAPAKSTPAKSAPAKSAPAKSAPAKTAPAPAKRRR